MARDSEAYARSLAQAIVDGAESLADMPNRGHRLRDPELSLFRELIIGSYRLVYLVEPERVLIVGVLHGRRAVGRTLRPRRKL